MTEVLPPFVFFLDMDGVLNNARVSRTQGDRAPTMYGSIDPVSVAFLNTWARLVTRLYHDDVLVVLSSTWRSAHQNYISAAQLYGGMGLELWPHKDHRTRPTGMSIGGNTDIRGLQIADWLLDHPEITKWIIIDDSTDFLPYQRLRHIHTHVDDGILSKHHDAFIEMLPKIYAGEI